MKCVVLLLAGFTLFGVAWAQLPGKPDSFKFAVIGDTGTGGRAQYEVGARLAGLRKTFQFQSVLMLGDNLYDDRVVVPANIPPGTYELEIALLDSVSRTPKVRLAIEGRTPDGWYVLGKIRVER